jgi:diguanylate cyclase (GGDEF)-like protein
MTAPSATTARLRSGPRLGFDALDALMPMHIWAGATGHILHAGPTLAKLSPDAPIPGQRLCEFLEFRRPRVVQSMDDLAASAGNRILAQLRAPPRTALKGHVVVLPRKQGVLLNLSLGISVAEVVRSHGLTGRDFAPSDPTVEMLYLIEAQSAVMAESRRLNQRLQGARIAAEEQAFTDTLTGLKNRRALDHVLGRLTGGRRKRRFGLMHVDLDFFKEVNDGHGHAAGDHVLQSAARIFVEETRADDIVARIGGDEFVLILMNCDDPARLDAVARRIIARLEAPIRFENRDCRISASIGTTLSCFYDAPAADQMIADADAALYHSKRTGRGRVTPHLPPGPLQ